MLLVGEGGGTYLILSARENSTGVTNCNGFHQKQAHSSDCH